MSPVIMDPPGKEPSETSGPVQRISRPVDIPTSASGDSSFVPSEDALRRQQEAMHTGDLFGDGEDERTVVVTSAYELRPRFVGRSAILDALRETFAKAADQREPGFAVLVGASGMGKSRLTQELLSEARRHSPTAVLMLGAGDETATPYAAVVAAFRDRFGILPSDGVEVSREKIVAGVAEVVTAARVPEVAHLLAQMMRVPFDDSPIVTPLVESPQRLESRTFMALRRFLAAEADRHPVLLVIENLQLCGQETINLVQYLAAGSSGQRIMIALTATPQLFERYPTFGDGDIAPKQFALGPLQPDEAEELFRELCRPLDHVPERILQHVRTVVDSPRTVHELVRLMLESGCITRHAHGRAWRLDAVRAASMPLPYSYEDLLNSRLAAMDEVARRTLQMAAVVGEVCWFDAILAIDRANQNHSDDPDGPTLATIAATGDNGKLGLLAAVSHLIEAEWLWEVRESAVAGERELRFGYQTLWQVVYRNIAPAQRAHCHAAVAQWLELHPEERGPTAKEEVARHLELANENKEAAVRYRQAADAARAHFDNERAIRLYDRALACIGDTDLVVRIDLWHDLGSVYELVGDFEAAIGAFERMLRLAWVAASKAKAAVAFNKMGRVWRRRGDLRMAVEYLERGLELFRAASDGRGIASSLDDLGRAMHMLGRYDEAYQKITEGLARRGRGGDIRAIAASLSNLGTVQRERGQFEAAFNCHREALELRRQAGDRWGQVVSQNNLAALAFDLGDWTDARAGWTTALTEAESIGALPLTALILTNLGELALAEAKLEEARSRLENALEIILDIEDRHLETECNRHLAALEVACGNPDKAEQSARRALQVAQQAGLIEREALANLVLGEVLSVSLFDTDVGHGQQGRSPAASAFQSAIELAIATGNDATLGRALFASGRFLAEQGDVAAGRDRLRDALAVYSRLGLARQMNDVERLLASLK